MKKFFLIALCLVLAVSAFSGCSAKEKPALVIGEAQVSREIFAYFFDEAYSEAVHSGGDLSDRDAITQAAVDKCCEYVGTVTLFNRFSLSFTAAEKDSIAVATEAVWKLYSGYYTAAGISKQTVHKINEADKMRTALLLFYYGEGREYEVSEEEIEYYFDQTYVQFKAINGYLTTINELGETVALTQEQADALRAEFEDKRKKIEDGATFAEVNGGTEAQTTFVEVDNTAYPEGFLQQIATLEYGVPTVIEIGEYIFLVERIDAKVSEENNYQSYRTDYIEALRGESMTDLLVATAKDYTITRDEDVIKDAAKAVTDARAAAEKKE